MIAGGAGIRSFELLWLYRLKMDYLVKRLKLASTLILVAAFILSFGCSSREAVTEKSFVGKWRSSRIAPPIYLYTNGEWEIKTEDGAILQYGVWQYKNGKIIWSYKVDSHIGHDANAVISATPREFQIQESDRTTTTFTRLD
jgi:hypothetical protein